MKRRAFVVSSALGSLGLGTGQLPLATIARESTGRAAIRKILIAGGGYGTAFIRYMATLTGKPRPRLCYLPTASADSPNGIIAWLSSKPTCEMAPRVLSSPSTVSRLMPSRRTSDSVQICASTGIM